MTALLTLQNMVDLRAYSLSINFNKEVKQKVLDSQEFDLRPFMGESFFLALVAAFNAGPLVTPWVELFDEFEYTYDGNQYENPGIKRLLAQYTDSRYIAEGGATSTAYGNVIKTHGHSTPIDSKLSGRKSAKSRSGATALEDRIILYLTRNKSTYPLWRCNSNQKRTTAGFVINAIG